MFSACCRVNRYYLDILETFREALIDKKTDSVLLNGVNLLSNYRHLLGDELWTVMEEVYLASLEHRQDHWAKWCYKGLHTKFGDSSVRVSRLRGMGRETLMDWSAAVDVYKNILQDKPEDSLTRKRLISVLKAQRKTSECVEHLNRHLDEFIADTEAWHELADIYITECTLGRAIFCFDELVCRDPRNLFNCITYAELNYSTGNVDISRKYFCLACSLDPSNVRALWGLLLVTEDPLIGERSKKPTNTEIKELTEMATSRLITIYSKPQTACSSVGRSALDVLRRMKLM
eukprot:GHVS01045915.1.p1 GENE.GHVS01045915.1~~GHVS01045915.1.p1  ORF type:complete len:289 (-),score=27.65 GHVS01045915.1:276-1142(-)